MRSKLFFAIGLGLCSAVAIGNQASQPAAMSSALRVHIKGEVYGMVSSIRGLPLGVRDELQALFGSQTLDIAEPGAKFQESGSISNPKLPIRRLALAGCSIDHCIVYYERGVPRTWHAALFHWTPEATRLESGGLAPAGLASIDDVRNAILSGAIKNANKVW